MRMQPILRITIQVVALGLVLGLVWSGVRLASPTPAQRAAIAKFEQPVDRPGHNAFGTMLTAPRAVPDDRIDAVVAEHARRMLEYAANHEPGAALTEADSSLKRYPELAVSQADYNRFCKAREPCLARVRADLPAWRDLIETHGLLIDRLERITQAGHYRQPWPHSPVALGLGEPSFELMYFPATRHAVQFEAGHRQAALEGACRALAGWRRIGATADSVLVRMIAQVYAGQGHAGLIADMLAEMPLHAPLPAACEAALAPPPTSELMLCNALRGEYALVARYRELFNSPPLGQTLVFDAEATAGMVAERYARFCGDDARGWIENDVARIPAQASNLPWSWQCIANFSGCQVVSIIEGIHVEYALRGLDFGFRLKALATLAWLRGRMTGGEDVATLLGERPEALRSPTRDLALDPDRDLLRIPLHASAAAYLPLPARGARPAQPAPPPCPE